MNNSCYRFEKIKNESGLLDNSVDATYVLHLEGNGRLDSIRNQLNHFHITKTVYIVFNKGYKTCEKNLHIEAPTMDLIHAFINIFKHSVEKGYNNILILEDDFEFSEKIKEPVIYEDINFFINKKADTAFVYYLGCIPYLQIPYYGNHNKIILSSGTHACVYSRKTRNSVLSIDIKSIKDWDEYNNLYSSRYMFYQPLCYQLVTDTENSREWSKYSNITITLIPVASKMYFKWLKLDKSVEPGFTDCYKISKILSYSILLLLVCLLIFLASLCYFIFIMNKQKRRKLKR